MNRSSSHKSSLARYVPLLCWVIAASVLIYIPLKVLSFGFVPAGDARRHVAQAISGVAYTQTVVMRPEYSMDHSPGWDWLLRNLHLHGGWGSDALIGFSVASVLLVLIAAGLPWARRPEAWLAALLAMTVAIPEVMTRWTQARPYLLTEAILIGILFAWRTAGAFSWKRFGWTAAGIAVSVWVHGAWYLWALPVGACFMARQWRAALWLGCSIATGILGGALLTGHPIVFLLQALKIASTIAHEHVPQWMLVGEFRPSYGEFATLVMIALVLLWRSRQTEKTALFLKDPAFCLIVLSWILGFHADRFWADWGVPAVIVWMTIQFAEGMETAWDEFSGRRVLTCVLVAVPLALHSSNDLDRRYTACLEETFLDAADPAHAGWLPEGDGIFYSADMEFFYNTYYRNPKASWRYIIGFEPALMPDEDLKILRNLQRRQFAYDAFQPWVNKMRTNDRLAISSGTKPNIPQLDWHYAGGRMWIGKVK